jgi:hypothetical protein
MPPLPSADAPPPILPRSLVVYVFLKENDAALTLNQQCSDTIEQIDNLIEIIGVDAKRFVAKQLSNIATRIRYSFDSFVFAHTSGTW